MCASSDLDQPEGLLGNRVRTCVHGEWGPLKSRLPVHIRLFHQYHRLPKPNSFLYFPHNPLRGLSNVRRYERYKAVRFGYEPPELHRQILTRSGHVLSDDHSIAMGVEGSLDRAYEAGQIFITVAEE